MDEDGKKIGDLEGVQMYLGMIPVDWTMKVSQSYHMVSETDNDYQGDGMTFDITLYAEQLTNSVRLVNKYLSNTDVSHHVWNGAYADFSYKSANLSRQLKQASAQNAKQCIIVGDEFNNNELVVKDMVTGRQETIKVDNFFGQLDSESK